MENFEEKACLCALNRIFGFEPKIGLALLSHLGSASEVFSLSKDALISLLGPYSKYKDRICRKAVDDAAKELIHLSDEGVRFCGITEPHYPSLLKECEDPPIGLYIKSATSLSDLWKGDRIAVVGTRDISTYGKEWCSKIVSSFASAPSRPAIVSGLALGVDIQAHKTALENGLPTIAVLPTGPDAIYPHRHKAHAERIASAPGSALITDYPPGTAPLAIHFLRRNRIIAGLSKSTILIESKIKGGGMMTCRLAFSYNRDVYALPGRIEDTRSQGCNELIRQKIAEPISSIAALSESLGLSLREQLKGNDISLIIDRHYTGRLESENLILIKKIVSLIRRERGITLEEISDNIGCGYSKAVELAGLLEIDDFIITVLLQRCSINPKFM
jgi:DNA processing protein